MLCSFFFLRYFFFFQAEDGIRDGHVTGVQTCALPISPARRSQPARPRPEPARASRSSPGTAGGRLPGAPAPSPKPRPGDTTGQGRGGSARSEEHTSELQSRGHLVCRLLLEKKKRRNDG